MFPAWKEFDRFPERAEEKFKGMNDTIAKWRKDYADAVTPSGRADDFTAAQVKALGAATCVESEAAGRWAAEFGARDRAAASEGALPSADA